MFFYLRRVSMKLMYVNGEFTKGNATEEIEGLDQFRETKHVHWDFNMEDKDYWYPYGR